MGNEEFLRLCKVKVAEYTNSHMDKIDGKQITVQYVYVVWSCKTLQNSKALLSTTVPDGMYYELTYNGDKHELYLDAYKKFQNIFFFSRSTMLMCLLISWRIACLSGFNSSKLSLGIVNVYIFLTSLSLGNVLLFCRLWCCTYSVCCRDNYAQ